MNPHKLNDAMLTISTEARNIFRKGVTDIQIKSDGSLITDIDESIYALGMDVMEKTFGKASWCLVGEESETADWSEFKDSEHVFVFDPLDGTKLAANNMPHGMWVMMSVFKRHSGGSLLPTNAMLTSLSTPEQVSYCAGHMKHTNAFGQNGFMKEHTPRRDMVLMDYRHSARWTVNPDPETGKAPLEQTAPSGQTNYYAALGVGAVAEVQASAWDLMPGLVFPWEQGFRLYNPYTWEKVNGKSEEIWRHYYHGEEVGGHFGKAKHPLLWVAPGAQEFAQQILLPKL